ncbi:MAG: DUF2490 domain-containing protein [Pyrinomonadaceae bacterium]
MSLRVGAAILTLRTLGVALISSLTLVWAGVGGPPVAAAQTRRPVPEDDTQQWSDAQLSVPVSKEIDFVLNGTLRVGDDLSRPVDERIGVGFSFKAGKYLTFYPNYTNISARPANGRRAYENRLSFAGTLRLPLGRFTLSDRHLFERRLRSPFDSTRYRNRLTLEHPFTVRGVKFQLFVSDEVFYDWSVNVWVRNRFTAGASRRFNRQFTTDFYYLRQHDGRSRPGDLHVLGTTFRIRL